MKIIIFILVLLTGTMDIYAQMQRSTTLPGVAGKGGIVVFPRGIRQSSGDISYLLAADTGNSLMLIPLIPEIQHKKIRKETTIAAKPFLQIHGNVMYDLYYQSGIDTPFQQKNVYQHTLQTYLDITVKDQYPFRIGFSTTRGNAALFRNITGINMQYTNRDFKNMLLDKLQHWDASRLKELQGLEDYKTQLNAKKRQIDGIKSWLSGPAQLQRIIEERERKLYAVPKDTLPASPDLSTLLHYKSKPDTVTASFEDIYAARAKQLDSLQQQWEKMEQQYRLKQQQYGDIKGDMVAKIMASRNNKELADQLKEMNLPDSVLPKGYKTLLAVRSFGIGRTMVDYSELTAKDISLQGVQAEYNPSYYVAVATGVIDYRFRNYIVNNNGPKQYLSLIRVGLGMKEGNHLYFTYYTGKKQLYNLNTTADSTSRPDYRLVGMALEGRWQLTKNTYFSGEVARSSLPYYQQTAETGSKINSLFRFNNPANQAYALKAGSYIPRSGTRITAMYKSMGAGFQSFSLYTTGSAQTAWSVRVDQPFFKQQLTISAAIRQNDYTSQYQQADYKSNTVFKSIQATLRIRHWPVVTVGYYPSSQLTKLGDNSYLENLFYTLVGSVSHFYKYRGTTMNTTLSYTQFYNRQTDSNFVYFNTKNLLLNHTMFLGRFSVQGTGSAALNSDYALYGADGNVQYKVNKWLEAGGGLKYSLQTVYNISETGYTANVRVNIPHLGLIELMADKGFIPGVNKRLVSNNTGRVTYTKIF